jgi:putative ABC transport system permease protein
MSWLGLLMRNLLRRPGRSTFTLIGVALAVGGFLALASLSHGLQAGSQATLEERRVDLLVMKRGMVEVFGGSLPAALGPEIRKVPGVQAVSGELNTMLQLDDESHIIVSGWDEQEFMFGEMKLLRGRLPGPAEAAIVVGDALADARGLDVGREMMLDFVPFKVVGIGKFDSAMLRGLAIVPLSQMQKLLARPAQVTLFQVRLAGSNDAAAREAVRARIAALGPNLLVLTSEQALQGNKVMAMMSASSLAIALVGLMMACLTVLNTLAMSVEERTREIGILSAIGWPPRRILALILSEGMLLAAIGGVVGVILGLVADQLLATLVLPGSGLTAQATVGIVLTGMATALGVGSIGALWPAWRASRLAPAAALRHQ